MEEPLDTTHPASTSGSVTVLHSNLEVVIVPIVVVLVEVLPEFIDNISCFDTTESRQATV
jgi:hypothetical protein